MTSSGGWWGSSGVDEPSEGERRLGDEDHRSLVLWAADCAERALPYFEVAYPNDVRPQNALKAARAWARGEITLQMVRDAASAADDAALDIVTGMADDDAGATQQAARYAARAASHAAGTADQVIQARHAAVCAAGAISCAHATPAIPADSRDVGVSEQEWQFQHLPPRLRRLSFLVQGRHERRG